MLEPRMVKDPFTLDNSGSCTVREALGAFPISTRTLPLTLFRVTALKTDSFTRWCTSTLPCTDKSEGNSTLEREVSARLLEVTTRFPLTVASTGNATRSKELMPPYWLWVLI